MTVEWVKQSEGQGRLTLVARVNRYVPIRVPITVTVTLPPGLHLVAGKTSWVIDGSESTSPVEEVLVFDGVSGVVPEIVLSADVTGSNFGIHAKRSYSTGPAVQSRVVAPYPGPKLEVGGRDFGPSVPATP